MAVRLELRKDAGKLDPRSGPWIRRKQVGRVLGPPDPSAVAALVDRRGKVLGHGLYSPESAIVLRMIRWGERAPEPRWLEARVEAALLARRRLGLGVGGQTTGYREVNSEGDGLPGLVVDRFGAWRVLQVTTAPMAARIDSILAALGGAAQGLDGCIVLGPRSAAEREGFPAFERVLDASGGPGDAPEALRWLEHGQVVTAPAPPAQKTGAYHDQRDNRRAFASLVAELPAPHLGTEQGTEPGAILDLGCHVGGFAIAAARASTRRVVAVDQSAAVLEYVVRNAAANGLEPGRVSSVRADMFGSLDAPELAGPFSAIVFDPPKIASSRRDLGRATGAMARTSATLLRRLEPGGVLALCSCSHHLGVAELDRAMLEAGERSGRPCSRVAVWGPGPDHPVWPCHVEGEYLRVAVYQRRE